MEFFSSKHKVKQRKIKKGKSAGIHITDQYIRAVFLENKKDGVNVIYSREIPIPENAIKDGEIVKPGILEKKLSILKKESGMREAYIVIPDEYSHSFILHGYEKGQPIDELISRYIQTNYELDPKNMICRYEIIEGTLGNDIEVNCMSKDLIDSYESILVGSGIKPVSFEGEAQTISRLLVNSENNIMIDFGDRKTKISTIKNGFPKKFICIDRGGGECREIIQKFLDISSDEAEKIYGEYGFLPAHHEKGLLYKLTEYIQPIIDVINDEQLSSKRNLASGITNLNNNFQVIIYGDHADTRGFLDYISSSSLAEPRRIGVEKDWPLSWSGVPKILKREVVKFAPAIYAATRGFVS